ncbi:MurR/RpiR family transcriptional regulator [Paraburkholderia hayleyella]|uniref:MurR/RpiR family transcriptional regulator n=1 Tax=Paraburkholderia hayleyella TaxID=2152889 RepID=UPI001291F666|nr:MurR/RpiR family transcriptional regulator [Paraburkholderia hayleyella]
MLLSQIKTMYSQLRPSERKLADYLTDVPREVLDLSMTELATRAGVSQPTIARFCHALGFSGFREFKIRLAQAIVAEVPTVFRDVRADEPAPGVAAKVLDRTIGALIQVRNNLSSASVEAALTLLAQARRIEFYGAGGSGIVALDVQHKFFRLGMPSVAYADPHTFLMSAALLAKGDVVVAISNTGRTRDIIEAAQAALAAGAKVIAITHGHSPLARLATVGLFANVDEDADIFSPMTSRVSHLAIGDILAVGVALRLRPEQLDKLAQTRDVLRRRRIDDPPAPHDAATA